MADYEMGEVLHATGSLNMSLTGVRAFEAYCRQAGTRINAMFEAIERGADDHDIASHFKTDCDTVRVYRAVLAEQKKRNEEPEADEGLSCSDVAQTCSNGNEAYRTGIAWHGRANSSEGLEGIRSDPKSGGKDRPIKAAQSNGKAYGDLLSKAKTGKGAGLIRCEHRGGIGEQTKIGDGYGEQPVAEMGRSREQYDHEKAKGRADEVKRLAAEGFGISRIAKKLRITRAEVMRIMKNVKQK